LIGKKFWEVFNEEPILVRSPGRVNLIGEHTDYNEGFVLPAAIDKAIYFAISARNDSKCYLMANDLRDSYICDLKYLSKSAKGWPNYLLGVIDQLQKKGYTVPGFNCIFGGDIPIGAGLSSSAAIEAGLVFTLNEIFHLDIDKLTLVQIAQKAENEFVGVKCGIMDQLINIFGLEKQVLKLDCRSLEFEYFPFEWDDLRIVLCDSQVQRQLATSKYNLRRRQCEQGVRLLQKYSPTISSLRDVEPELLEEHQNEMDEQIYRRCKYVIEENNRVLSACDDLMKTDLPAFGRRMNDSHAGLRDDFEVSCTELDELVDGALGIRGVLGARMMGAGFGGCTINLVQKKYVDSFFDEIERIYRDKLKKSSKIYVTKIVAGTSSVNVKESVYHDK
jgi:galactokinase